MEFVCESFDEVVYRVDMLGDFRRLDAERG